MRVSSALHGFVVKTATSNGVVVGSASFDGLQVQSAGRDGVRVTAAGGYGIHAVGTTGAGRFIGDVTITGSISKGSGMFRIDHPLDPANKYLAHSFVESPDMMNVYNGNIVLDHRGEAWVDLPSGLKP